MRPRIRIRSDGTQHGTMVEMVGQHGTITPLSDMVTGVEWTLAAGGIPAVKLTIAGPALEVLGDLTEVQAVNS